MPAKNYASRVLKILETHKGKKSQQKITIDNLKLVNDEVIKEIFKNNENTKKRLYLERDKLISNAKKNIKELKEAQNIDLSKEFKDLKILFSKENLSKKELNELINSKNKEILKKIKKNKGEISEIEVFQNIFISEKLILKYATDSKSTLDSYKFIVNYLKKYVSNLQYQDNSHRKNVFMAEALKNISEIIKTSENIDYSINKLKRDIFSAFTIL